MLKYLPALALLALTRLACGSELPVPPIPPANAPLADSAPVPNIDVHGPVAKVSEEPTVDVKVYPAKTYDPSLGFAPGSRYQTTEDRKPVQTPGLIVSVPLK